MLENEFLEKYMLKSDFAGRGAGQFPKLNARDALCCIAEGQSYGHVFEGVEGFIVHSGQKIQPSQVLSTDRADSLDVTSFVEQTINILIANLDNDDRIFEVVFSFQ